MFKWDLIWAPALINPGLKKGPSIYLAAEQYGRTLPSANMLFIAAAVFSCASILGPWSSHSPPFVVWSQLSPRQSITPS